MRSAIALALALATVMPALAQEEPKKETQAETIARLVTQLGAESYEDRESAQRQLEKIGRPVIPALEAAKASKDLEVASRAADALLKIRGVTPPRVAPPKPAPQNRQRVPTPDMDDVLKELERQLPGDMGKLFRRLFPAKPGAPDEDEERTGDPLRPRIRTWTWSLGPDGKVRTPNKKRKDLGSTLGLGTGATSAALRAQLEIPRLGGRVVNRLTKGGFAARHGLKLYDVIVSIDGRDVRRTADLEPLLHKKCKVEVYRKAKLEILELPSYASELEKTQEKPGKEKAPANGDKSKQRSF